MALLDTMPLLDDPLLTVDMLIDDVDPLYPAIGLWAIEIGGGDVVASDDMVILLDMLIFYEVSPLVSIDPVPNRGQDIASIGSSNSPPSPPLPPVQ